jgi:hypothetical protein
MACPDCGSSTGNLRFVTSVETHGLDCGPYEVFNEEFVVCCGCGGRYDICDWEDVRECMPVATTTPRPNCVQSNKRTDRRRCAHANTRPHATDSEWSGQQEIKHLA